MQGVVVVVVVSCIFIVAGLPHPNGFLDNIDEPADGSRGLGYKKKTGPATARPTWRPWVDKVLSKMEMKAKAFPDGLFPDDYYDNYDPDIEGTRRNMLVHKTFEERMKSYIKVKQLQQSNPASAAALLKSAQKAASKAKKDKEVADGVKTTKRPGKKSGKNKGVGDVVSGIGIL